MIDAAKSVESEKSPVLSPLAAKEREMKTHNIFFLLLKWLANHDMPRLRLSQVLKTLFRESPLLKIFCFDFLLINK